MSSVNFRQLKLVFKYWRARTKYPALSEWLWIFSERVYQELWAQRGIPGGSINSRLTGKLPGQSPLCAFWQLQKGHAIPIPCNCTWSRACRSFCFRNSNQSRANLLQTNKYEGSEWHLDECQISHRPNRWCIANYRWIQSLYLESRHKSICPAIHTL